MILVNMGKGGCGDVSGPPLIGSYFLIAFWVNGQNVHLHGTLQPAEGAGCLLVGLVEAAGLDSTIPQHLQETEQTAVLQTGQVWGCNGSVMSTSSSMLSTLATCSDGYESTCLMEGSLVDVRHLSAAETIGFPSVTPAHLLATKFNGQQGEEFSGAKHASNESKTKC